MEMMAGDVPKGIKVQLFSNRLTGGNLKEPKRNICSICKEQFSIEILNFSADEKPLYLHMIPHSFMPQDFLVSFKNTFNNFIDWEISSFYINVKETIKILKKENYFNLKINKSTSSGFAIPKYPDEVIGNTIIIPLNSKKLSETERYLRAVDYALFLNKYFNFKIVVTESAIPIFNKNEFSEIFFDGLPSSLRGFIKEQNLDQSETTVLWEKYLSIRNIADTLNTDDAYLKIILGMIKGEQNLFFTVDRLIEEKLRKSNGSLSGGLAQYLVKEIYDSVEKVIKS